MITWEYIYNLLGITDFIYFISSPIIQETLFPLKIVFIFFTVFFFGAVMYFYVNSSYLQVHFLQDTVEFVSWQPYGLRQINKRLKKIQKMAVSIKEDEQKLAIIEADDFFYKLLEDKGYDGETFEELLTSAESKLKNNYQDILSAHKIRNSIVYDSNYKLDQEEITKTIGIYEKAIRDLY